MRVLVDTNVLLDVLGQREPFWPDSARVWTLAETGRLDARISAISFNNVYHIVRRWGGRVQAERSLRLLRDVFDTVDLTRRVLSQAVDAGFDDFEDAIQYFSAQHVGAEVIVTRNAGHFPRYGPPAMNPTEFLAAIT